MKTGLYIGRFQPFHLGHLSVVRQALKEVDRLYIAIGSSQYAHTNENPFTAEERLQIIRETLKENKLNKNCEIFFLPDIHDDVKWVSHVQKNLPEFQVIFIGDQGLVKKLFEKYAPNIKIVMAKHEVDVSGTRIREKLLNQGNWEPMVSGAAARLISDFFHPSKQD